LSNRVKRLELPAGVKDINDFHISGGDLRGWLLGELDVKAWALFPPLIAGLDYTYSQPGNREPWTACKVSKLDET